MPAYRFNRATGVIRYNRRNVGTVRPHPTSASFVGRIGQHVAESYSADQAFHEVAARALGYPDHRALRLHNAGVRRSVRERTQQLRARRDATYRAAYSPRPALNAEQLTMQLQRERAELGEPPLTAEQIAVWTRR